MSNSREVLVGMVTSGVIATVIAVVVILVLSRVVAFPWTLGQTMLCTSIATFAGSAVSYRMGFSAGSAPPSTEP